MDVFAHLLGKPGVALADPAGCAAGPGAYVILECFPTSAWRSSGLRALPAKGKKPDLAQFLRALSAPYSLPRARVQSHDDLQALVAALSAAAAAGGPATALPRGAPAKVVAPPGGSQLRVEGYIWDVQPIRSRPKTPRWT